MPCRDTSPPQHAAIVVAAVAWTAAAPAPEPTLPYGIRVPPRATSTAGPIGGRRGRTPRAITIRSACRATPPGGNALARPALRRSLGEGVPSATEAKLVANVV